MRLIDEIEAAAKVAEDAPEIMDATPHQRDCYWLMENDELWPRIKAALEAGEEMAKHAGHDGCDEFHEALNRFRAAAGEG